MAALFLVALAVLVWALVSQKTNQGRADARTSLLINVGAAFLTVALIEVGRYLFTKERCFEQFFGEGSLNPKATGKILLRSDDIGDLMQELLRGAPEAPIVKKKLDLPTVREELGSAVLSEDSNRLFKARHWINARDAEGAKAIREKFIDQNLPPPELEIIQDHHPGRFEAAPYVISMGMGFSARTKEVINNVGKGLISINPATEHGDAIVLDRELFNQGPELGGPESGMGPVFPKNWEDPSRKNYRDYAIILRHVKNVDDHKYIEFVLAGFTEDGTAAAGRYFGGKWRELYRKYVEGKSDGPGEFFLAFIVPESAGDWRESNQIGLITRDKLNDLKSRRG